MFVILEPIKSNQKLYIESDISLSNECYLPSSSLRSPANSADSEREASEVRLEEPDEAWLGGRLPISLLIQCSHSEELVDPKGENRT